MPLGIWDEEADGDGFRGADPKSPFRGQTGWSRLEGQCAASSHPPALAGAGPGCMAFVGQADVLGRGQQCPEHTAPAFGPGGQEGNHEDPKFPASCNKLDAGVSGAVPCATVQCDSVEA